jgi:hypothetical protein
MAWYASLLTALLQRNTFMRLKPVVSIGLREAHKCFHEVAQRDVPYKSASCVLLAEDLLRWYSRRHLKVW